MNEETFYKYSKCYGNPSDIPDPKARRRCIEMRILDINEEIEMNDPHKNERYEKLFEKFKRYLNKWKKEEKKMEGKFYI